MTIRFVSGDSGEPEMSRKQVEKHVRSMVVMAQRALVFAKKYNSSFDKGRAAGLMEAANYLLKNSSLEIDLRTGSSIPKIGNLMYVNSAMYIGHGEDDRRGGLATIESMKSERSGSGYDGKASWFVAFQEIDGHFNYQLLLNSQEELKKEYGSSFAHADPDFG